MPLIVRLAGCTCPARDEVDWRLLDDLLKRRVRWVDHPDEVGGWPALKSGEPPPDQDQDGMSDAWELIHELDPRDSQDGSLTAANGFTHLEKLSERACRRRSLAVLLEYLTE